MSGTAGRKGLLDRVVDHMLETGTATVSLRALATEIGSSHRMLIYHFGNQHGLVQAVVDEVEARQRAALADLAEMTDASAAAISLAFWNRLASPELRPVERLFFQLHARLLELGDDETASRLLTDWLASTSAIFVARGYAKSEARQLSRIGIAVSRGLLLDLVATGDDRAVNAAARAYIDATFGA